MLQVVISGKMSTSDNFYLTQESEVQPKPDSVLAFIYCNGEVTDSVDGVSFTCDYPRRIRIRDDASLNDLSRSIRQKLGIGTRSIVDLIYRCPSVSNDVRITYSRMHLRGQQDMHRMLVVHSQLVRAVPIELYVVLGRSTDEILHLLRDPSSGI